MGHFLSLVCDVSKLGKKRNTESSSKDIAGEVSLDFAASESYLQLFF